MTFINPDLKFIKYGRRKIKVKYKTLKNCYGEYDPNKFILYLSGQEETSIECNYLINSAGLFASEVASKIHGFHL